jgi:hypothetical protein
MIAMKRNGDDPRSGGAKSSMKALVVRVVGRNLPCSVRREADPVGVVEDLHVGERRSHALRVLELEPAHLDATVEWVGSIRMAGEGTDPHAALKEELGEMEAAVPERPGDRMDLATHDVLLCS